MTRKIRLNPKQKRNALKILRGQPSNLKVLEKPDIENEIKENIDSISKDVALNVIKEKLKEEKRIKLSSIEKFHYKLMQGIVDKEVLERFYADAVGRRNIVKNDYSNLFEKIGKNYDDYNTYYIGNKDLYSALKKIGKKIIVNEPVSNLDFLVYSLDEFVMFAFAEAPATFFVRISKEKDHDYYLIEYSIKQNEIKKLKMTYPEKNNYKMMKGILDEEVLEYLYEKGDTISANMQSIHFKPFFNFLKLNYENYDGHFITNYRYLDFLENYLKRGNRIGQVRYFILKDSNYIIMSLGDDIPIIVKKVNNLNEQQKKIQLSSIEKLNLKMMRKNINEDDIIDFVGYAYEKSLIKDIKESNDIDVIAKDYISLDNTVKIQMINDEFSRKFIGSLINRPENDEIEHRIGEKIFYVSNIYDKINNVKIMSIKIIKPATIDPRQVIPNLKIFHDYFAYIHFEKFEMFRYLDVKKKQNIKESKKLKMTDQERINYKIMREIFDSEVLNSLFEKWTRESSPVDISEKEYEILKNKNIGKIHFYFFPYFYEKEIFSFLSKNGTKHENITYLIINNFVIMMKNNVPESIVFGKIDSKINEIKKIKLSDIERINLKMMRSSWNELTVEEIEKYLLNKSVWELPFFKKSDKIKQAIMNIKNIKIDTWALLKSYLEDTKDFDFPVSFQIEFKDVFRLFSNIH